MHKDKINIKKSCTFVIIQDLDKTELHQVARLMSKVFVVAS